VELRRYLHLIRQRLLLVVALVVAGAVIGFATTSRTPQYTATTLIYVGAQNLGVNDTQLFAQSGLDEVVASFALMIPSPVIAQRAIDATHVDRFSGEVASNTVAVVEPSTSLISVSVTDANPSTAVRLANGVSSAFVNQVSQYQTTSGSTKTGTTTPSAGTRPNEPAYVFQNAVGAAKKSSGLTRKVILGALFGLVLAILIVLLLDYLDITIKSPEELERRVGLPVLGIIPLLGTLPLHGDLDPPRTPVDRPTGAPVG
jgi:capsular polysaccharide biosynthesis protein